jgi:hypothetical protein
MRQPRWGWVVSRDPEQVEREQRWARGRPVSKPRNTPAVMRVRLAAIGAWKVDEKLATLEAASRESRR